MFAVRRLRTSLPPLHSRDVDFVVRSGLDGGASGSIDSAVVPVGRPSGYGCSRNRHVLADRPEHASVVGGASDKQVRVLAVRIVDGRGAVRIACAVAVVDCQVLVVRSRVGQRDSAVAARLVSIEYLAVRQLAVHVHIQSDVEQLRVGRRLADSN